MSLRAECHGVPLACSQSCQDCSQKGTKWGGLEAVSSSLSHLTGLGRVAPFAKGQSILLLQFGAVRVSPTLA